MNTYLFTFGQAHLHPETGEQMKDYFLHIEAPNAGVAVDWMVSRFGWGWSDFYSPKRFDKSFFPKGRYGDIIVVNEVKSSA